MHFSGSFFHNNCFRVNIFAHVNQVLDARLNIVPDGGEVNVGDLLLLTELPDGGSNEGVVGVVDPGEEVVFDLVVEATVQEGQPGVAHVGGGDDLKKLIMVSLNYSGDLNSELVRYSNG